MRRHRYTTVRSIVLAGVMSAALGVPAMAQDLRSPDVRDQGSQAVAAVDLRSPDARDAGSVQALDLRSPDASDPVRLPAPPPVAAPSAVSSPHGGGFDLVSALIGAGIALTLTLAGFGSAGALGRRRGSASRRGVAAIGG